MKTLSLTVKIIAIVLFWTVCAQAQGNSKTQSAQSRLTQARIDSAEDYQKFKSEAEATIKDNNIEIKRLKTKRAEQLKRDADRYNTQVADLEQRNKDLKKKIDQSSKTESVKWATFKLEFQREVNDLKVAFREFGNKLNN
jgi:phage host-nuclease inhibitor protein Gam